MDSGTGRRELVKELDVRPEIKEFVTDVNTVVPEAEPAQEDQTELVGFDKQGSSPRAFSPNLWVVRAIGELR